MRHPEADSLALDLRDAMADVFAPRDIRRGRDGLTWIFYGKLTRSASVALTELAAPFARLGFAPFLHTEDDQDVIIAYPTAALRPAPPAWSLHIFLLLLTFATLTLTGAALQAARLGRRPVLSLPAILDVLAVHGQSGLTFAAAFLLILAAHELGHYFAARRHGMLITPPYFLPAPPPPIGLGTLGAFIALRSPVTGRRPLFDVAVAGPLAGVVVALPILWLGLRTAPTASLPFPVTPPLLAAALAGLARGPLPAGLQLDWFHPPLFAAWLGLTVTAINLLPVGQLDGGHIAYAALGPRAVWLARLTWLALILMTALAPTWGFYALLVLVAGLGHPAPQDDITPLDRRRAWGAFAAILLLVLTFAPRPVP